MLIENLQTAESNGVVTAVFKSENCKVRLQVGLDALIVHLYGSLFNAGAMYNSQKNVVCRNLDYIFTDFFTTNLKEAA